MMLDRFKLRTKLVALIGFSALGFVGSSMLAADFMHQRMIDDRIGKLHAAVDVASGVAGELQSRVEKGQITRDQMLAELRSFVHRTRFDDGQGYVNAQSMDGVIIAHGTSPDMEGKPSQGRDASGKSVTTLVAETMGSGNSAVVYYSFHRPGGTEAQQKLAYVQRFSPLNGYFLATAYTDDLETTFHATMWRFGETGAAILLGMLILAWCINRDISGSLGRLRLRMSGLGEGDLAGDVPDVARRDEVGQMARVLRVLQEKLVAAEHLAAEQAATRERVQLEKLKALAEMADQIEDQTSAIMRGIVEKTGALMTSAASMASATGRTAAEVQGAASAAEYALTNAQVVASAAEQLAASIREISAEVGRSTQVVGNAVQASGEARGTIEALNQQVAQIGAVTDIISDIASRTNLLALNATIEAARAGEAGKGFAVVASEVKQLAAQTARSTEEISRRVAEVAAATGASVDAVGRIGETISEINAIAATVAAAVEQQGAATAEIARTIAQTAAAAQDMTGQTVGAAEGARETGRQAALLQDGMTRMNSDVVDLQEAIVRTVRTSTAEVERRRTPRSETDLACVIGEHGSSRPGRVRDISAEGAQIWAEAGFAEGGRGTLTLDRMAGPIPFSVVRVDRHGGAHCRFDTKLTAQQLAAVVGGGGVASAA